MFSLFHLSYTQPLGVIRNSLQVIHRPDRDPFLLLLLPKLFSCRDTHTCTRTHSHTQDDRYRITRKHIGSLTASINKECRGKCWTFFYSLLIRSLWNNQPCNLVCFVYFPKGRITLSSLFSDQRSWHGKQNIFTISFFLITFHCFIQMNVRKS